MKVQYEATLTPDKIKVEDGGQAMIVYDAFRMEDGGLFVRLHSWDENRGHPEFSKLVGRRVRITVETLD